MRVQVLTRTDLPGWATFESALVASGLPTDDLTDANQAFFRFADGAAFGGFAWHGAIALFRSLVVAPELRGQGLGSLALAALCAAARRKGLAEAWLLTASAQCFFMRHGFVVTTRDAAPPEVREHAQFRGLCPASAVLMCRTLP